MMSDIFSSFDDHNSVFMSYYLLVWVVLLSFVFNFNMLYWGRSGHWVQVGAVVDGVSHSQSDRSRGKFLGGFMSFVGAFFVFIITMNLLGLVPYVFGSTSHLVVSISLSIPVWLAMVISSFSFDFSFAAAGLLPSGAPGPLNPFLVLVETISVLIRPCTLAIRLMANMSAGHIILGLVGGYLAVGLAGSGVSAAPGFLWLVQSGYFMFEVAVSLVQGYIFMLLVTLYADEHS
uniref:ATP synthase subunit a n=1 Tax=Fissurella volcano TaxID=707972 RepID=H6V540_FISVO|nr:ATP synthase F0 subunit 6 [Fissurella volcano]AFB78092.1 ATP synthase F0 subunit 6 [Fissurella volcano]